MNSRLISVVLLVFAFGGLLMALSEGGRTWWTVGIIFFLAGVLLNIFEEDRSRLVILLAMSWLATASWLFIEMFLN